MAIDTDQQVLLDSAPVDAQVKCTLRKLRLAPVAVGSVRVNWSEVAVTIRQARLDVCEHPSQECALQHIADASCGR